ncbi:MAG: ancA 3, partial [Clostridia bacterium]|nr:ancA 3 [Clostridia bacterium]
MELNIIYEKILCRPEMEFIMYKKIGKISIIAINFILILFYILTLSGCDVIQSVFAVKSEKVSVDITDYNFTTPGETLLLTASVLPEDTTDKAVVWKSSNEAVAIVSPVGIVTPISDGAAVITVTSESGKGMAACTVYVDFFVPPIAIALDKNYLEFTEINAIQQITATVFPENATQKGVIWSSGDILIASVDENGIVTSRGNGETLIEAKTEDGLFIAVCGVTVNANVPMEDVNFEINEFSF